MAGKHEPPTQRSFYFSLATSTLRALILVAAVVLGVVVLRGAFPGTDSTLASGEPSPAPTRTTPSPKRTTPSPAKTTPRKPKVQGVVVQVLNGTSTTGLAASASETLQQAGYTLESPGNASSVATTTIYFRQANKVDAEFLRDNHFPDAVLKPATPAVPPEVMIQVVLGSDFAEQGALTATPTATPTA